jgi:hypothetical protein
MENSLPHTKPLPHSTELHNFPPETSRDLGCVPTASPHRNCTLEQHKLNINMTRGYSKKKDERSKY